MATSGIQAVSPGASSYTPTTRNTKDFRSEDFFKLLITQLQHQDPLKPNDSNQLVQEVANIRQMDVSANLDKTLSSFAQQQRIGGATGMIGRYVTGSVGSGGRSVGVQGIVVGVQFTATGEAVLQLHTGDLLPLKNVTSVTVVDPTTGGPIGNGTPPPSGDGGSDSSDGPPGGTGNQNP